MIDALSSPTIPSAMVPAGYAEKAMASLMQLHSELMDEKERRVDLFRRLMEREQALAELKMYVKVLEEKLTPRAPIPESPPVVPLTPPVATKPVVPPQVPPAPTERPRPRVAPVPPQMVARARLDSWKTW